MSSPLQPPGTPPEQAPPSPDGPRDDPRLLWSSVTYADGLQSCDKTAFPTRPEVHDRYVHGGDAVLPLEAFMFAVWDAHDRLLVLDAHFDHLGVATLADALDGSGVSDVRLLTGSGGIDSAERQQAITHLTACINSGRIDQPRVQVRWAASLYKRSFPYLHDRFAIVDGALWHFGATVGGGHPGLTAASGPWPAADTRADVFFEECWRIANA